MSEQPGRDVPVWVRKRDGRLMPFEADRISRALFAASESLHQPDAFLARELTDSVVHFLIEEQGDAVPNTAQIAETVVKTVRELGHPLLARTFEDHRHVVPAVSASPLSTTRPRAVPSIDLALSFPAETPLTEVLTACRRSYSLQAVFARDVVAVHNDGLLVLQGLEAPDGLAACVLDMRALATESEGNPAPDVLRRLCGQVVVLDGPEHHQARSAPPAPPVGPLGKQLQQALRWSGLGAIVNLNSVTPPASVDDLAGGPLFAGLRPAPSAQVLASMAEEWLEHLLSYGSADRIRVDWHLAERDFGVEEGNRERLHRLAAWALAGANLAFVFDRPRKPVALAEGITRQHPAVLQEVWLNLPRLAELTGSTEKPDQLLRKLGSLARLALSAGEQKRAHLRRRHGAADMTEGFLLDRARLLAVPVGLDAVVRRAAGRGLCAGGAALDLGKQIVQTLRDVLRHDGRMSRLETCLDGPAGVPEAGLTPWEPEAAVKTQWRSAGALHALADHGTLQLFLPADVTAEQVVQCFQQIAEQTDVVRVVVRHSVAT